MKKEDLSGKRKKFDPINAYVKFLARINSKIYTFTANNIKGVKSSSINVINVIELSLTIVEIFFISIILGWLIIFERSIFSLTQKLIIVFLSLDVIIKLFAREFE